MAEQAACSGQVLAAQNAGATPRRGLFIVLEGGEGAGKSTQLQTVKSCMQELGFTVECTREPGGTKLAEQIRSILLTKDPDEALCSTSELLLMYAARAQLVRSKIRPLMEQGVVVISDRFDLSTIAYQGYGRGFDLQEIKRQFFTRVRQGYLDYAQQHPDEVCMLDGSGSVEQVAEKVRQVLQERFGHLQAQA